MPQAWIVCYDVTDPRRAARARRRICRHAMPLQKSVFWLVGTETQRVRCLQEVTEVLKSNSDDLRCYPVSEASGLMHLGAATLPEGILWSGVSGTTRTYKATATEPGRMVSTETAEEDSR